MMSERYGNFAEGMSWREIDEKILSLDARIERLELDIETLKGHLAAGNLTQEDFNKVFEPLDQQLSIAKYNRAAYLDQFEP